MCSEMPGHSALTAMTDVERSNAGVVLPELDAAARELLLAYGLEVGAPQPMNGPCEAGDDHVAAMMGFMGDAFEGVLAMQAPTGLLDACSRLPGSIAGDAAAVADWIGELTNQLLGRMYNKLLSYERITRTTRPMFAPAGELGGEGSDRERTTWLRVPTSAGDVLVVLELHATSPLHRSDEPERASPLREGELTMF
jgi:hypothetical protein